MRCALSLGLVLLCSQAVRVRVFGGVALEGGLKGGLLLLASNVTNPSFNQPLLENYSHQRQIWAVQSKDLHDEKLSKS